MIPIILCGGEGSRLWPIKKLFYPLFDKHNLLEMSLKRLQNFNPALIVSVEELRTNVEKTLENKNYNTEVIYEPIAKNTAVSIALACHFLKKKYQFKGIVGIFPSDHFIGKVPKFQKLISLGIQTAQKENQIVTFGIRPSSPSSNYGYIKIEQKDDNRNQTAVKKAFGFIEKPKISQSSFLLKEGCLWNAGIFLSPLNLLIKYFEKHLPHLWESLIDAKDHTIHSVYKNLKPISFDRGIMENIDQFLCLPFEVDWSDLGSWDKITDWNQNFPGRLNNKALVFQKKSKGNFIFSSEEKPIGLLDINNNLIIQDEKGLLIAGKKRTDKDIQYIHKEFQKQKSRWIKTPWGSYAVIKKEDFFKYKQLKIRAGQQLSYQSHQKRKEHWLVVEGQAEAIVDGVKKKLQRHEHLFIDQGVKHRLKNPTDQMLTVLEIQIGTYLEEDDIVRYEDDYGRS